ncbi:MAG: MCE family protein [Spirochaetaceae bacterium]|nr:MAG: MCE family protein [Spirochaetaceae bacterium]
MRTGSKTRAAIFTLISAAILVTLYSIALNFVFSAGPSYEVEFNHAGTISRGTVVSKLGIKIGSVVSLEINPKTQTSVLVGIRLDRNLYLREDENFAILTRGMFGDQTVEVYPGSGSAPIAEPGTRFQGEPTIDLSSIMADGGRAVRNVSETSELLNELLKRNSDMVEQVVANLSSASARADALLNNLDDMVGEGEIAATIATIQQAALEVAMLGARLSDDGSTLARLQDHTTGDRIEEILANLVELSDNLRIASEGIRLVFEEIEDE